MGFGIGGGLDLIKSGQRPLDRNPRSRGGFCWPQNEES